MAKYAINEGLATPGTYSDTIEAAKYRQEGEYFVFYGDGSFTKKVLTVDAAVIKTIRTVDK